MYGTDEADTPFIRLPYNHILETNSGNNQTAGFFYDKIISVIFVERTIAALVHQLNTYVL